MKLHREEEKFTPITITIETEEELEQLYAVSNFTPLNESVPLLKEIHYKLRNYRINYENAFEKMSEAVREFYGH